MRGNLSFAYPLEQCARLHLQVLGSLICGKPFCFHVSLFSHSGNARSRRLRGRLCRVLSRKRTRFLRVVAAIISTDLVEDVSTTLPESPIDFRRATRCCRSPTSPALSVTRKLSPFTSVLSYSVTSGFIWNCPRLTSTVGDPTTPLPATFTGACSLGSARFFR